MSKDIIFIDHIGIPKEFAPIPAITKLPNWYKELDSYIGKEKKPMGDGISPGTVKKCIPFLDAMTAGYYLLLPADVYVSQKDGKPYFEWGNFGLVQFHNPLQINTHPSAREYLKLNIDIPKWMSHWGIKTSPGYSSFFTNPINRDLPFTILDGIVDTDRYNIPINFPFVLNDITWEGMIPAGTPFVQVIPFKRDSFKMNIETAYGDNKNAINFKQNYALLQSKIFDSYKTRWWSRKEYK